MKKRIAVVGGCNIDITATSYSPLVFEDSNPGRMKITLGGVGRNIAENLARLGHEVHLISAVGNDQYFPLLQSNARAAGLDLSDCLLVADMTTSCYLCINQPDGNVAVAVAAMDICECMTPDFLSQKIDLLNACDYVVMDANLPQEAVLYVTRCCKARLCADTVSEKKAGKLCGALPALYFLKANRAEAEKVSGLTLENEADFQSAAEVLHRIGVRNLAITAGKGRAYFSNGRESCFMPPMLAETVNSTGCGDAFFAGALSALAQGQPCEKTLARGLAMASLCAGSDEAVSPAVTQGNIEKTIRKYAGGTAK